MGEIINIFFKKEAPNYVILIYTSQGEKVAQKKQKLKGRKRIVGMDGLRALAVLLILLYHVFPKQFPGGFVGVSLFFALSGYLVAWTSFKSIEEKKFSLKTYYLKRLKRIYPALLLVVFFSAGIYWFMDSMILDGRKKEILSIFFGYNNYYQISQNADYFTRSVNASPYTHLWAIAIEMQFYLLWPLFLKLYQSIKKTQYKDKANYFWLAVALLSFITIQFTYQASNVMPAYYGSISRASALFLGVSLACWQWYGDYREKFLLEPGLYGSTLVFIFALMIFFMGGQSVWTYRVGLLVSSIISVEFIRLVTSQVSGIGRYLDIPILKWIANCSYEVYLWQYPILFFFQFQHLDQITGMGILIIAIILVFAHYSHGFLEDVSYILLGKGKNSHEKA